MAETIINPEYELQLIHETSGKEKIYRSENSIVTKLPKNRNCVTISHLNGGYMEDPDGIFNHHPLHSGKGHSAHTLEGGSVPAYLKIVAERLLLDPKRSAGMLTAANMKYAAIINKSFRDLDVTAIVTAGIEVNGGRAGDPASYYEEDSGFHPLNGTINTILIINADLSQSTLIRALMTAVEAKTVAVGQLMAPSRYSHGIATGSGTDQISVISNMESKNHLHDAGKHSKLGELIGKCIIEATTKALSQQSDLNPESQCDILTRLDRFEITVNDLWKIASAVEGDNRKPEFTKELSEIQKNPAGVALTAAILHIVDEISWGLIPESAGKRTALVIMKGYPELMGYRSPDYSHFFDDRDSIIENWIRLLSWCIKNGKNN